MDEKKINEIVEKIKKEIEPYLKKHYKEIRDTTFPKYEGTTPLLRIDETKLFKHVDIDHRVIPHKQPLTDLINPVNSDSNNRQGLKFNPIAREAINNMDATLSIRGRDVEEAEKALNFDSHTGIWKIIGNAEEQRQSKERHEICNVLMKAGKNKPLSPKEIADELNTKPNNISKLLSKMLKEGIIASPSRGKYTYKK